jgi:TRAP transporter TAXI family solute receptor
MSVPDGSKATATSIRRRRSSPFLFIAAALLLFAAVAGAAFMLTRPTTLRIAVGPAGSDDQKLITELAQTFVTEGSAVRLTVIPTAGPVESLNLLNAGETDLAVGRADEDIPKGAGSVAILRKNVVVLWTPAGAPKKANGKKDTKPKIKEIGDLEGRKVGVLGRTQVNVTLLKVILTESGLSPDKVTITSFSTSQASDMIKDPSIDAFMTVGPLDSKITTDAITMTARLRGEPAFLPVDVSEALAHRHPLYEAEEIPGSSFTASPARPDDTVDTVGVNHLIVAPKSLADTSAGAFTRALFAVRPTLVKQNALASKIEKPDTDKDAAIPAHAGAAAYIDGTERTFLDRYSDYFWGALLVLSALGSGAAWLRHYAHREERDMTSEHRDKLLAALSLVRKTDSLEELDTLQKEADDFLRETLESFDDGAVEESDLTGYGLVLEQFHRAVADRRNVLDASPTAASRVPA